MAIIRIAHNAVTAKLYDAPRTAKMLVSQLLSYKVEGVEHMAAFQKGGWDGRSTFFSFREAKFPAGFVSAVQSHLQQKGYQIQLVRKPLPAPNGPSRPKVDPFPDDPRYDYQPETVNRLLRHGKMIAQVATGGGKSRIAKLAYCRIKRPTLFLTTRAVLMYQMKDSFEETLPGRVGIIGDSEFSPVNGMNVGMVQTIAAAIEDLTAEDMVQRHLETQANSEKKKIDELRAELKKKKVNESQILRDVKNLKAQLVKKRPTDRQLATLIEERLKKHHARRRKMLKLLERMEFVIGEEAHEAGGNSYYEILNKCPNAHYRLALTATPFMRADGESNMRLMACFGQIGIRVTEKLLIDRGILAKPYFKYLKTEKPPKLFRTTAYQRAYKLGIVENFARNKAIVKEAVRGARWNLPVMILVQQKMHGRALKEMLDRVGVKAEFIFGESDNAQRRATLAKLASGEIQCLIGSTILDVGVDVPAVGMVILAGGGKAEVALRQRIGRGLRAKKNGPNVAFVVDFCDENNSTLREHAMTRRGIVESTPGFAENILPDGADFDFAGLGLAA